jgi:hypothetical protein
MFCATRACLEQKHIEADAQFEVALQQLRANLAAYTTNEFLEVVREIEWAWQALDSGGLRWMYT